MKEKHEVMICKWLVDVYQDANPMKMLGYAKGIHRYIANEVAGKYLVSGDIL